MKWYAWLVIGAVSASLPWMLIVVDMLDKQDRTRQREAWKSVANRQKRNDWGV